MGLISVKFNNTFKVEPDKEYYYPGETVRISMYEDRTTDVFEDYGKSGCYGLGYYIGEPVDNDGELVNKSSNIKWTYFTYKYSTANNNNQDFLIGYLDLVLPEVSGATKLCLHRAMTYSESTTPPTAPDMDSSCYAVQDYLVISKANAMPTISGTDSDLGQKEYGFTIDYSVNDADSADTLNVTVKLDNTQLNNFTATRNTNYTIDLTNKFNSLSEGQHKVTISVTDSKATVTRTYTFTKIKSNNNAPTISGTNSNLGYKKENFTIDYTINDADSADILNVNVKLDQDTIKTIEAAERNKKYTADIDISNIGGGKHTVTINVTDSKATVTRTYTFYKAGGDNLTDSEDLFEYKTYKLDLKKDRDIYIKCMQLDDLILNLEIVSDNKSVNAEQYKIELAAGTQNNAIITENDITATGNIVRVAIPRQATAIAGENTIELKFTNATGKQKRSFPITLNVIESLGEKIVAQISITKLQKLEQLLENIDGVEEQIKKNADNVEELKKQNDRADILIPQITKENEDSKNYLPLLIKENEEAEKNINELKNQNSQATENIEALNSIGDATDLAKKVEDNRKEIEQLKSEGIKDLKAENVTITNIEGINSTNVQGALQEVFTNADNGKGLIVNAIIGKGESATKENTFQELADKISKIETGIQTTDATATAEDIRVNKTAYVNNQKISGNIQDMPSSIGGVDSSAFSGSKNICKGVANNEYVGAFDLAVGPYYINGQTPFRLHIPNLIPSNIVKGAKIGWEGNYIEGTKEISGFKVISLDGFTTAQNISVNVDFQPKACAFIVDEVNGISGQTNGRLIAGIQYFKCFNSTDYAATQGFTISRLQTGLSSGASGTNYASLDITTTYTYENGVFTFKAASFGSSNLARTKDQTNGSYLVMLMG